MVINNMNTLTNEILSAIDNVDNVIMESEMNVVNILNDLYNKTTEMFNHIHSDEEMNQYQIFNEYKSFKYEVVPDVVSKRKINIFGKILNMLITVLKRIIKRINTSISDMVYNLKHKRKLSDIRFPVINGMDELYNIDDMNIDNFDDIVNYYNQLIKMKTVEELMRFKDNNEDIKNVSDDMSTYFREKCKEFDDFIKRYRNSDEKDTNLISEKEYMDITKRLSNFFEKYTDKFNKIINGLSRIQEDLEKSKNKSGKSLKEVEESEFMVRLMEFLIIPHDTFMMYSDLYIKNAELSDIVIDKLKDRYNMKESD